MANMAYARFENTYRDLVDCSDHLHDDLSETEEKYRKLLIELCKDIAAEFADEPDEDYND